MPSLAPETQYVKTDDGVYVAHQVAGDGPTDLVFLDGWATPLEGRWEYPAYAATLDRLRSFSRLIPFDKRGIGLSDPVPFDTGSTLEEWTSDVATVMDAVGSDRAAILGSHDGGWPAMLFAAAHPERVSHLVLVNCTARIIRAPDYECGIPARLFDAIEQRTENYGASQNPAGSRGSVDEFGVWWSRARRHQASPSTFRALMAMQIQVDLRAVLPTIRVPTLVVHRVDNDFWRLGHGRYLADAIPGATFLGVPGDAQHWQIDEPWHVLDAVEEFVTGTRAPLQADRVLATVLFTDIVGSTETLAAVGDRAWRQKLDVYERRVREVIARHSGREVFTKGDEFLVSFDGPARAVRCAVAIRDEAARLGLQLRTGVHTGEVELRGEDIAGIAVHIGARVMAAAGPGEILVSRTVTDLVAGSGLEFEDRGSHKLKGVDNEWQLFAVK